ncbi:MAG: hypothetical protein K2N48_12135 [Muribaculaceae bacterium]|nr:hypothetical protein [Muribaculaceae bacterium]
MPQSLQSSVLQPSHTKAVIQASMKSTGGRQRVWCIVESDDDVEVFERFFLAPVVSVLPSTNEEGRRSYHNVESIVLDLYAEERNPQVFGIRDRDYTSFSAMYTCPANIFLTDDRDLEMMMLKSSSVIEDLRSRDPNFPANVSLSSDVMRFLGYLRIYNDVKQLSCTFKDNLTKVSLVWDNSNHYIYPDYKDRLFSKFQDINATAVTRAEFDQFIAENNLEDKTNYDICRGHDVCRLLCSIMIKKQFSNPKVIFQWMKDSYSFEAFQQTSLYHDLVDWSDNRGLTIFP